ncbi:MAG: FAD-binding oxidoreductase [Pseudomonadota bacterium]
MSHPDVLVVGAGITGAVAAYHMAQAGAQVHVVDRYGPAAMASGWTLAGVRQSGRDPAELPLARAAVALWPELEDRLGAPTHYRQQGNVRLARTPGEVAVIRRLVETQSAAGLDLTFLPTLSDVRQVAPAVSDAVLAASYCPTDGHADPNATVAAFLNAAARHGATLDTGEAVAQIVVEAGAAKGVITNKRTLAAGRVVLAAGVCVNTILERSGLGPIPITTPLVTVVRTAPVAPVLKPVIGVANADLAVRQEMSGAIRFTSGTRPHDGAFDEVEGKPVVRPAAERIAATINGVAHVLPAINQAPVAAFWGGLLDMTPDALPVIDTVSGVDGLVVAAGFSGHGFGIGPITGEIAADLALGRAPRFDTAPFRYRRFSEQPKAVAPAAATLHG